MIEKLGCGVHKFPQDNIKIILYQQELNLSVLFTFITLIMQQKRGHKDQIPVEGTCSAFPPLYIIYSHNPGAPPRCDMEDKTPGS